MQEFHVEGVAIHDGPESCAGVREDAGEAFDRGTCGPGIEPRNHAIQGADVVIPGGRQHERHRHRKMPGGSARSETLCTRLRLEPFINVGLGSTRRGVRDRLAAIDRAGRAVGGTRRGHLAPGQWQPA